MWRCPNPKDRGDCACRGKRGADHRHPAKSEHERFVDCVTDELLRSVVDILRNVDGCQLDRLTLQRLRDWRRQIRAAHSVMEMSFEHVKHDDPKYCDRDQ